MRSSPTLLTLLLAACGPSAPPVIETGPPEEVPVSEASVSITPAETAVIVAPACTEGADERCDAVDQNCDGAIDEGCGYGPGAMQVALAWNSDADLDLRVTGPSGETLDVDAPSATGGELDRQARGACAEEAARDRIEHARWQSRPEPGTWSVAVRHRSGCDAPARPTTATVSIALGGAVLGTYNVTVEEAATVDVATWLVP